jgi:hypothetical protein
VSETILMWLIRVVVIVLVYSLIDFIRWTNIRAKKGYISDHWEYPKEKKPGLRGERTQDHKPQAYYSDRR